MERPEHRLRVDVAGGIELRSPRGIGLELTASGPRMIVAAGNIPDLLRVWREFAGRADRRSAVARIRDLATLSDVTVELQVGARPVAKLGPSSSGTWLTRKLGLGEMEFSLPHLVAAALAGIGRRRRV